MRADLIEELLEDVRRRYPRSLRGLIEARTVSPEAFVRIATTLLEWLVQARGRSFLLGAVDAFAKFSSDVNMAQARYEISGCYENKSFEDCRRLVYGHEEAMTDYLWGVYLSNFLWAHHLELMLFFEQRFLPRLSRSGRLIEVAPGHGAWGLWALRQIPDLKLTGYDVSPTSIEIAGGLARAAGLQNRVHYEERNALDLCLLQPAVAQVCICCFLVEHLEDPVALLNCMAHVSEPGAMVFFTGALTAAQVDHIYEFRSESELVVLAEQAGFRVLESLSVAPARRLAGAKYLPRSMALVMQRKTRKHW